MGFVARGFVDVHKLRELLRFPDKQSLIRTPQSPEQSDQPSVGCEFGIPNSGLEAASCKGWCPSSTHTNEKKATRLTRPFAVDTPGRQLGVSVDVQNLTSNPAAQSACGVVEGRE